MPLNFTGVVFVEIVHPQEEAVTNSPRFRATVLVESTSGVSVPFGVSVWVDPENNVFPPVENQLFQLDGKLSSDVDEILMVEALRFHPVTGINMVLAPFIIGTGLFMGRPEDGLFNLKCPTYASGNASFIMLNCFHSSKQYQNVAKTIQKQQEIFVCGILQDVEGDNCVVLKGSQFSYLSKAQKMLNTTHAVLNAVKTSNDGTRSLMSPRKQKDVPGKTSETLIQQSPVTKKAKRGPRKTATTPQPAPTSDEAA